MKITVTTASGEIFELNVSETLELENLKAICESIFGIPPSDKCIFRWYGRMLTDPQKSLKDYGIMDGDYLQILSDEEKAVKITIITASEQIIELSVSEGLELENLKAMCELKLGIPPSDKCVFKWQERILKNPKKCLKDYGITDGEILQILFDEEKKMKIAIITGAENITELNVSEGLELGNLKAICEFKLGISPSAICAFKWQEKILTNPKKCLKDYGITNGEILRIVSDEEYQIRTKWIQAGLIPRWTLEVDLDFENITDPKDDIWSVKTSQTAPKEQGNHGGPHLEDPERIRQKFLKYPDERATLKERNPPLSEALETGSAGAISLGFTFEKDLEVENSTDPKDDIQSVERSQTAPKEQEHHKYPNLEDPERIRQKFLKYPDERATLKERNPPLSEALETGSAERFAEVFNRQQRERFEKEQERLRLQKADQSDPEVIAYQKEQERLQKVEENMESAVAFVPESLCQVQMMYINCKVNKYPVKAFVDTGAQMTIMNQLCAERCNIMHLVDYRWAGIAVGVGTQRIVGRVHLVEIEIGSAILKSSFSILEDQPVEMILGLDLLKRHMCTIDLARNVLVIKKTNGEIIEMPFLPESELPHSARLTLPKRLHPRLMQNPAEASSK